MERKSSLKSKVINLWKEKPVYPSTESATNLEEQEVEDEEITSVSPNAPLSPKSRKFQDTAFRCTLKRAPPLADQDLYIQQREGIFNELAEESEFGRALQKEQLIPLLKQLGHEENAIADVMSDFHFMLPSLSDEIVEIPEYADQESGDNVPVKSTKGAPESTHTSGDSSGHDINLVLYI
jgi:hypothetical protein